MAQLNVATGTHVTFADGQRFSLKGAVMSGIRDDYHINMTLDSGGTLTNVPHVSLGRYVGWYVMNPNEIMSIVNATTYRATV